MPGSTQVVLNKGLRNRSSAFSPGRRAWSPEATDELIERFVNQPDVSGSSFQAKLAKQLDGASDEAILLFAELMYLCVVPLWDYHTSSKRDLVNSVLHLMKAPAEMPQELDHALRDKVFSGGVAFKTRRYFQLAYLCQFAREFVHNDATASLWDEGPGVVRGSAALLGQGEASRDDLEHALANDQPSLSYASRATKVDELHRFLNVVRPDDVVVTTDQQGFYVGRVTSATQRVDAPTSATFQRSVEWTSDPVDQSELSDDARARLKGTTEVVELTRNLDDFRGFLPLPVDPVWLCQLDLPRDDGLIRDRPSQAGWMRATFDWSGSRMSQGVNARLGLPPGWGMPLVMECLVDALSRLHYHH